MSTQYLFVAAIKAALKEFQINCAKLQVQTQIIDKMLWQLCYGKISFIVLIPVLHPPVASPQPGHWRAEATNLDVQPPGLDWHIRTEPHPCARGTLQQVKGLSGEPNS